MEPHEDAVHVNDPSFDLQCGRSEAVALHKQRLIDACDACGDWHPRPHVTQADVEKGLRVLRAPLQPKDWIIRLSRSQRMVCDVRVTATTKEEALTKYLDLPDTAYEWDEAGMYDDCEAEGVRAARGPDDRNYYNDDDGDGE